MIDLIYIANDTYKLQDTQINLLDPETAPLVINLFEGSIKDCFDFLKLYEIKQRINYSEIEKRRKLLNLYGT